MFHSSDCSNTLVVLQSHPHKHHAVAEMEWFIKYEQSNVIVKQRRDVPLLVNNYPFPASDLLTRFSFHVQIIFPSYNAELH